jgi:hypothetical protein
MFGKRTGFCSKVRVNCKETSVSLNKIIRTAESGEPRRSNTTFNNLYTCSTCMFLLSVGAHSWQLSLIGQGFCILGDASHIHHLFSAITPLDPSPQPSLSPAVGTPTLGCPPSAFFFFFFLKKKTQQDVFQHQP